MRSKEFDNAIQISDDAKEKIEPESSNVNEPRNKYMRRMNKRFCGESKRDKRKTKENTQNQNTFVR